MLYAVKTVFVSLYIYMPYFEHVLTGSIIYCYDANATY